MMMLNPPKGDELLTGCSTGLPSLWRDWVRLWGLHLNSGESNGLVRESMRMMAEAAIAMISDGVIDLLMYSLWGAGDSCIGWP